MNREHDIQNRIRVAISQYGKYFRINSGTGWTSNDTRRISRECLYALEPGDVVLKNARTFSTGTPPGYTDLSGVTPVKITPEMVGRDVAVFLSCEVKTEKGPVREEQYRWAAHINSVGGIAVIARSLEAARAELDKPFIGVDAKRPPSEES